MFEDMTAINEYVQKLKDNDIDEKTSREIISLWLVHNEFEEGQVRGVLEKEFKKTNMN